MGQASVGNDSQVLHEELVERVRSSIPSVQDFLAMERLFEVMGNPTRARILLALAQCELCVGDLCALLGMTKSAVSHQLANLRDERLVSSRREGRIVFYAPADPHVSLMLQLGLEHARECCGGGCDYDGGTGGTDGAEESRGGDGTLPGRRDRDSASGAHDYRESQGEA